MRKREKSRETSQRKLQLSGWPEMEWCPWEREEVNKSEGHCKRLAVG